MYQDKVFEEALEKSKQEKFEQLKDEVKTVERAIERFLTQMLECTASISERDFNLCGI